MENKNEMKMTDETQKQDMKTINVLFNAGYDFVQDKLIEITNGLKTSGLEFQLFQIWNDGGIVSIAKKDKNIKTEDLKFDVNFADNGASALHGILDFYKKIPNKNEVKAVYMGNPASGLNELGFEYLGRTSEYGYSLNKILTDYCKTKIKEAK